MKKRVLLLCALLAGLLLLSACGSEKPVGGEVTPGGEDVEVGGEIVSNDAAEEEDLADTPLSIGRMEGGVYTNEYLGVAATLDENWTFFSAEELQELPASVFDSLEGTELGELSQDVEYFTDMQAENVTDLTVLSIGYERFNMATRLLYNQMTDEMILDTVLEQEDMLIEGYAQAGIVTESMEKKTVEFLGEERWALHTVASIEGTPYYILQIFAYDIGEWGVTMTFASFIEDNTENLLDLFYKI